MRSRASFNSVVTRLVAVLVTGGLLASGGLTLLELQHAQPTLQQSLVETLAERTRRFNRAIGPLSRHGDTLAMQAMAEMLAAEPEVIAVRMIPREAGRIPIQAGDWSRNQPQAVQLWLLPAAGDSPADAVALDQLTLLRAATDSTGDAPRLELLVDGPSAWAATRAELMHRLRMQWLVLAVMVLLVLVLVRRWFAGPLSRIVELISLAAGTEPFRRLARQQHGEFRQLATALGEMLARIDTTSIELHEREAAYHAVYQQAPTAVITLGERGEVTRANRRALRLLGIKRADAMRGGAFRNHLHPDDRDRFDEAWRRLTIEQDVRCELRLNRVARPEREPTVVSIEAAAHRDQQDQLRSVRLSLMDVTEVHRTQRELRRQSNLLNLLLDHMSDAILLVDERGRVAACNRPMAILIGKPADKVVGELYNPSSLWFSLGVRDGRSFLDALGRIEAHHDRPAVQRFETRAGVFEFQSIPVREGSAQAGGRLWVVAETTSQEQSKRLLTQQNTQIQALKEVGRELMAVEDVETLLHRAVEELFRVLDVEAVGITLRSDRGGNGPLAFGEGRRSRSLLHRGLGPCLLEPNRELIDSVETQVMPEVLRGEETALWNDLELHQSWAQTASAAGLTSLAAVPLRGSRDSDGIVWIARRWGERIERQQLHLLETLVPLITGRLQIAELCEQMSQLQLLDPVTELPDHEQLEAVLLRLTRRVPTGDWSLVTLRWHGAERVAAERGEAAVNATLRQMARHLRRVSRRSTLVTRIEGPAFALLVPRITPEQTQGLVERLEQSLASVLAEQVDGLGVDADATAVSIACASYPQEVEALYDLRDAALVRLAKQVPAVRNAA